MKPQFRPSPPASGEIIALMDLPLTRGIILRGWTIRKDARGHLSVVAPSIVTAVAGVPGLEPAVAFESEEARVQWDARTLEHFNEWVATEAGGKVSALPAPAPPHAPSIRATRSAAPADPPRASGELRAEKTPISTRPLQHSLPASNGWLIHFDGGSRGNPGPAACGAVIQPPGGEAPIERARYLGDATNNVAEYNGVILALETLIQLSARRPIGPVMIRGDSQLAVRQLSGVWKIKDANLASLAREIRGLMAQLDSVVEFEHVYRERNSAADAVVNRCLDDAAMGAIPEPGD